MTCPGVTRIVCRILRDHHMEYHFNRYIKTLHHKPYTEALKLSKEQVDLEIAELWRYRRELQGFDEIKNGTRQKKSRILFEKLID